MILNFSQFYQSYSWQKLTILFLAAFLLRAVVFSGYVQYEQRFHQADSNDYHHCSLCITHLGAMTYPSGQPIFWRTPGYPWYLSWFYSYFGSDPEFSKTVRAHKASIWVQIFLCSTIPILILFLALALTGIPWIAWMASWLSVFHLGFVLSTTYIMSDALAMIPFILFLIFFYKSFCLVYEPCRVTKKEMLLYSFLAAVSLALFTWIRPNGQFVIAVCSLILLAAACSWKNKLIKVAILGGTFFLLISPWYIRNHNLTGEWFYCPMSGPVLQSFCVPKIDRYLTGRSFEECWKDAMRAVGLEMRNQALFAQQTNAKKFLSKELICKELAMRKVFAHPFVFAWEWIKESGKTTFDLYASQLVGMAAKTHSYDPLEEFLFEKYQESLYKQPMPFGMRIIVWLEFLFALLKWIGLFGGLYLFLIKPLIARFKVNDITKSMMMLWLKVGFLCGSLLAMTGGFGYARLRLPVDPLLIILSLTFWYWILNSKKLTEERTV